MAKGVLPKSRVAAFEHQDDFLRGRKHEVY
jgi:hypothetical protein